MPDRYTIACLFSIGSQFLCALESHCSGTDFIGHFSPDPYLAMPMTYMQACALLPFLSRDVSHLKFQVVHYPRWCPDQEEQHD